MYPLEKYKYYRAGNKIIAVTTFAGKTVRGVAKCSSGDSFSEEVGRKLAAYRCNEKVAKRRWQRAVRKCDEAERMFKEAEKHYNDMIYYEEDAYTAWEDAQNQVEVLLREI